MWHAAVNAKALDFYRNFFGVSLGGNQPLSR